MSVYEGLFAIVPDSPDAKKNQLEKIEALIKKFDGQIVNKVEWGKKSLGYLIKKYREAEFFIFDIELDPSKIDELRRALQLQDELLKYMITVKPENVTEPAPKATSESAATASNPA